MPLRMALRRLLEKYDLHVRAAAGLPLGFDLATDLKKYGVVPKCILDVGAHHGQTSLTYLRKFPNCRIFAFEPVASNFLRLQKATDRNQEIASINAAVGDQSGNLDIWLSLDNSQAHSLVTATKGKKESVAVTTIDDFCQERGIQPDFIKLDVEGYELKALAGARRALVDSALKAIVAESTFDPLNTDHVQIADLMDALKPAGFRLIAIHDQSHWQRTGQLEYFNALFIKSHGTTP